MLKIIKRISRLLALVVVYVICAYGYLTAKGVVFTDGVPVLSNHAQAKEEEFAVKVNGNVKISGAQLRARGADDAPLTMYAFSSMACSHCSDFHRYILPKLERDFISTGKLRYIFVHFPIDAVSMRRQNCLIACRQINMTILFRNCTKRKTGCCQGKTKP